MRHDLLDLVRGLANKLNREFMGVTLAGGCLRNPVTDRPIKDIDIFTSQEDFVPHIARFLQVNVVRDPLACNSAGQPYDDSNMPPEEMKVWKCSEVVLGPYWYPVDIIWVPSVLGRIGEFPDFLSQMWLGHNADLLMTPSAQEDLKLRRIRYLGSKMREKRLARFRELYGSRTLIDHSGGQRIWDEPWKFIDLDHEVTCSLPAKQAKRREGRPDYAPFWWDLPPIELRADAAWDAMHDLCKGQAGASVW